MQLAALAGSVVTELQAAGGAGEAEAGALAGVQKPLGGPGGAVVQVNAAAGADVDRFVGAGQGAPLVGQVGLAVELAHGEGAGGGLDTRLAVFNLRDPRPAGARGWGAAFGLEDSVAAVARYVVNSQLLAAIHHLTGEAGELGRLHRAGARGDRDLIDAAPGVGVVVGERADVDLVVANTQIAEIELAIHHRQGGWFLGGEGVGERPPGGPAGATIRAGGPVDGAVA